MKENQIKENALSKLKECETIQLRCLVDTKDTLSNFTLPELFIENLPEDEKKEISRNIKSLTDKENIQENVKTFCHLNGIKIPESLTKK